MIISVVVFTVTIDRNETVRLCENARKELCHNNGRGTSNRTLPLLPVDIYLARGRVVTTVPTRLPDLSTSSNLIVCLPLVIH